MLTPPPNVVAQKWTMLAFMALFVVAFVVVDVFAFENGAWATESQTMLWLFRGHYFLTFAFAGVSGGLLEHFAVPWDHSGPRPRFWKMVLLWALAFVGGAGLAWAMFLQRPDQD